jgi:hypothetical protein
MVDAGVRNRRAALPPVSVFARRHPVRLEEFLRRENLRFSSREPGASILDEILFLFDTSIIGYLNNDMPPLPSGSGAARHVGGMPSPDRVPCPCVLNPLRVYR